MKYWELSLLCEDTLGACGPDLILQSPGGWEARFASTGRQEREGIEAQDMFPFDQKREAGIVSGFAVP
jgi:hypothetical protein